MRGCAVSRRYIDVCSCDMFSVIYVYLDHFKSFPLWSSVYECHKVEYAFTYPVRTECSMFVMCYM